MSRPVRLGHNFTSRLPQYILRGHRRSISRFAHHDQQVTVQPVHIRKWWSPQRIATGVFYSAMVGAYLHWLLADVDIDVEIQEQDEGAEEQTGTDRDGESGEEQEEEDFEGDEDALFIPLTMAKKLPREFYKGSDPEWQEFKKIAPDKDRVQRIFNDLANQIGTGLAQHPNTARILGKDMKVRRFWLDVQFPYGPPQEYSRKGIEVGDTYIALSEQVIPAHQHDRLSRILWPSGTMSSIYAFYKTLVGFKLKKVKEALGLDTTAEPGSPEHRMDHMLRVVQAHEAAKTKDITGKPQTDPSSNTTRASGSVQAESDTAPPQDEGRGTSSDSNLPDGKGKWYLPDVSLGYPGEQAEKTVATMVFANSMRKNAKPGNREPPRGNIIVSGVLQAAGDRASIMFDVMAFYDPKSARFSLIEVSGRSIKPWRQTPKAGP